MDALRDAINNVSLYEVKAAVRKAQNVVMNYTEMEAKVREATNNEPWGASTTTMNEIASGTYNYQLLNEIMPMIYRRFTEKSAEEWRQIYKALQLLEYLIKNGAEQVIDDARSHLSTIKMLRQFYFIDMNGKDQGINVRNRAKELAELLSDVDRIRAERKKARMTKNKFGGVEGGTGAGGFNTGGMSGGNGFGRRFGGFGSEQDEFGSYSGGVYGDGGGFSGSANAHTGGGFHDSDPRSTSRNNTKFEEYDEYDEGATHPSGSSSRRAAPSSSSRRAERTAKPPPPKKKESEPDLLAMDDSISPPITNTSSHGKKSSTSALDDFGTLQSGGATDDDDFDDFQSATPIVPSREPLAGLPIAPPLMSSALGVSLAQPKPVSSAQKSDMNSLMNLTSPLGSAAVTPATTGSGMGMGAMKPTSYQQTQPNYFTSVPLAANKQSPMNTGGSGTAKKPSAGGGDAFGSIWNKAAAGIKKPATPAGGAPTLGAMAKEKASAGIWGTGASPSPSNTTFNSNTKSGASDLDDLLG